MRWTRGDARITASYAYLRATEWDSDSDRSDRDSRRDVPLSPRHTAGIVASIEREGIHSVGLEVYFTGAQSLDENPFRDTSKPYVIFGLLAERQFATRMGRARVFLNAENIGNVRQTKYDPLVRPAPGPGGRWTTDAWTELAGFTANGGIRLAF
jgi:iron complex outermembrane receptor protein